MLAAGVDEVEDGALRLADDGGVRVGDEVADGGGVPVIASGEAGSPRSCPAGRLPTRRSGE